LDDYTGNFCNKGKYPLIKAAVNALNNNILFNLDDLNQLAITEISQQTSTETFIKINPDTGKCKKFLSLLLDDE
jgi:hypothetical protein